MVGAERGKFLNLEPLDNSHGDITAAIRKNKTADYTAKYQIYVLDILFEKKVFEMKVVKLL